MRIDFSGKTALVTGATRGIGRQIALDLKDLGASLILTGTNPEQVETLNRQAEAEGLADRVRYIRVDFSKPKSLEEFIKEIEAVERIDVLVNNAAINRINFIDQSRLEDWDDMIAVNLTAPFRLIRTVSPKMKNHGYGRIINISSVFGLVGREKRAVYSASKFGLKGLTVSVSNELARHGVLVNTLSPGFVMTELTLQNLSQAEMDELAGQIPVRRLAQPEEISRAVVFLASDLNTYITGQNLMVDGGFINV